MRNTINTYFLKEFISLFALILISLSIIVWIVQCVNYLDIVTEDGHSFKVYFTYSLLNIPKIISRLIPFVFMISLLSTIMQFEKNNELVIFWTSGLNKINLVNFIIKLSILVALLQLLLSSTINPSSLNLGRSILKASDIGLFPSLLKEKKFNDTVEKLTVFIEEKKNNGEMLNILLRDDTSRVEKSRTIVAKKGIIKKKNGKNFLILFDGTIQSEKTNGKINFLNFNKTQINLSSFITKTTIFPKFQERTTFALLNCFNIFKNKLPVQDKAIIEKFRCKNKVEITGELNRRIGMPFYIPLISIIICYILSTNRESKYFYYQKWIVLTVGFFILIFAEILVRYSGKSNLHTVIYYLFPSLVLLLNYLNLIKIFKFENHAR